MKRDDAHSLVIDSITEALLQLMERKPMAEISISELCARAGISRISFYRNFDSMQDILVKRLNQCTDDWWEEYSKRDPEEMYRHFWIDLTALYREHGRLIRLIYQNDLSAIIKDHIFACCKVYDEADERNAYSRAAFAGAIYGLVDVWIRRGMPEFPEGFSIHAMQAMGTGSLAQ